MGRFWEAVAGLILRHPGLILVGSFVVLALPAYHGFSAFLALAPAAHRSGVPPLTYDMLSEMSPQRVSVRGTRLLEQYFPIGETGPIAIVARSKTNFDTPEERLQISRLSKDLNDLSYTDSLGVTSHPVLNVRCLTNPLGDPPGAFSPFTAGGRRKMAALRHPHAKATFLSATSDYPGTAVRFELICQYPPFSYESIRLLYEIERHLKEVQAEPASPWRNVEFDYTGITAGIRDLEAVNASDTFRVGLMVSLAVLAVLIFLIRRPLISLYLIFTVLFGYFVSLGLTMLFFAWVFGDSFQGLDWKLPIFLFVILVAVGEDYNIYLVTRVFEEQRRRGLREGLRVAVARTGGIITSCGVIMAGTFGSMATGTLRGMYELGFSLALGVLLDTFIIRTILVPAFLALVARWSEQRAAAPVEAEARDAVEGPHFEPAAGSLERMSA